MNLQYGASISKAYVPISKAYVPNGHDPLRPSPVIGSSGEGSAVARPAANCWHAQPRAVQLGAGRR